MINWLFDAPLAAGLLWLSWRTVTSLDLFKAIVLFIIFGLLMALCWARLAAPDVALAEAAIGAGLTGVLLLDAFRALSTEDHQGSKTVPDDHRSRDAFPILGTSLALLATALVGGVSWVLLSLPEPVFNPGALAQTRIAESGVSNPVTAVLLNFRGYDTLLEVAVLLLGLLGVWTMGPGESVSKKTHPIPAQASALIEALIHLLVPVAVLTAGYLLWAGAHAPGGAFQAAAVLAGIGVLLSLSERLPPLLVMPHLLRALLALGLTVFSIVALSALIWRGNLLEYPPAWAGFLILIIESTLTVSISLTLVLLFRGAPD